uniref:Uncharacterized protein n=1 Tax=Oryza punctata TaxID=4537 RepID=A0A0E0JJJ2_ORYPU
MRRWLTNLLNAAAPPQLPVTRRTGTDFQTSRQLRGGARAPEHARLIARRKESTEDRVRESGGIQSARRGCSAALLARRHSVEQTAGAGACVIGIRNDVRQRQQAPPRK